MKCCGPLSTQLLWDHNLPGICSEVSNDVLQQQLRAWADLCLAVQAPSAALLVPLPRAVFPSDLLQFSIDFCTGLWQWSITPFLLQSVVVVTTSADLISELCPILEQFLSLPFSHWLFSFVSFGRNKKLRYSITHHALDYLNIFPFLPLPGLFRLNCLIPCVAPKQIWNLNNLNKSHPLLWHLGVLQDV